MSPPVAEDFLGRIQKNPKTDGDQNDRDNAERGSSAGWIRSVICRRECADSHKDRGSPKGNRDRQIAGHTLQRCFTFALVGLTRRATT